MPAQRSEEVQARRHHRPANQWWWREIDTRLRWKVMEYAARNIYRNEALQRRLQPCTVLQKLKNLGRVSAMMNGVTMSDCLATALVKLVAVMPLPSNEKRNPSPLTWINMCDRTLQGAWRPGVISWNTTRPLNQLLWGMSHRRLTGWSPKRRPRLQRSLSTPENPAMWELSERCRLGQWVYDPVFPRFSQCPKDKRPG
jgi:hypothetical protein